MRKETWSVVMACALGALIGGLSALDIAARFAWGRYLWIFGALLGGVVAWCVVDFKQLCAGVARSYRISADTITKKCHRVKDWEPNKPYWRAVIAMMAGFGAVSASFFLYAFIGISIADMTYPPTFKDPIEAFFKITSALSLLCGIVSMVLMFLSFYVYSGSNEGPLLQAVSEGWLMFKTYNPISLLCIIGSNAVDLLRYGPDVVRFSISATHFLGDARREFGRFVVRTFLYIHSERRTICFVDATIGAMVGFFMGEALLGAIIGAVLGGVNYEIVSIRWLKLVPAVRQ